MSLSSGVSSSVESEGVLVSSELGVSLVVVSLGESGSEGEDSCGVEVVGEEVLGVDVLGVVVLVVGAGVLEVVVPGTDVLVVFVPDVDIFEDELFGVVVLGLNVDVLDPEIFEFDEEFKSEELVVSLGAKSFEFV